MRKQLKNLILAITTIVLSLSFSITAYAANGNQIKDFRIGNQVGTKFQRVSTITLYTNGDAKIDPSVNAPMSTELDVIATTYQSNLFKGEYIVTTSDRNIASAQKKSTEVESADYYKLVVKAGTKAGKATITLTDKNNIKKSVKLTVVVKTLVDEIDFAGCEDNMTTVAKGGKVALGAATNANATNKKLTYKIVSQKVMNEQGLYVEAGKTTVARVDGKGNVTGVNAGKVEILVSAQDQDYYTLVNGKNKKVKGGYSEVVEVVVYNSTVTTVDVLNPKKDAKGKYATLNLKTNATDDAHTFALIAEAYDAQGKIVEGGVAYSSSKPSVATVDANGKITAVGNGSAVITVTAAQGAKIKKPIKLNVKVTTDMESFDIEENVIVAVGKTYRLKPVIAKDVTDKKLTYCAPICFDADGNEIALDVKNVNKKNTVSVSNGTIKGLKEGTATIVVQDTKTGTVKRTVKVTVIGQLKTMTATVNGKNAVELYSDVKEQNSADIVVSCKDANGQELKTVPYSITSSNTAIASVEGNKIVARNAGKATITVKTLDGTNKTARITVTVKTKDANSADLKKDIDAKIKFAIKAEDYSWTGFKPSFNEKYSEINVEILNAYLTTEDAKDMRDELEEVFNNFNDAFNDKTYNRVTILDNVKDITWVVERTGVAVKLTKNGEVVSEDAMNMKKDIAKNVIGDDKEASAWDGRNFDITLEKGEAKVRYTLNFKIEAANVDAVVDTRIAAEIAAYNNDATVTGVKDVVFNAANNTVVVNIYDANKSIADVDAATREDATKAFKNIFAEAQNVTLYVNVAGLAEEDRTITFTRTDATDLDASINNLLDRVMDKLEGKNITSLQALNGSTVVANVSMKYGVKTYDLQYTLSFVRTAEAVDSKVDASVAAAVADLNAGDNGFGYANYDAANNALTVGIKNTEDLVGDLSGTGIYGVVEAIAKNEGATSVLINDTEMTVAEMTSNKVAEALGANNKTVLGDLVGKKAYVTVSYNDQKLSYTISFVLDVVSIDADIDTEIAAFAATVNHDLIDSVAYDAANNTMVFTMDGDDASKSVVDLKDSGVYEVIQKAIGFGDKIKADKAEFTATNGVRTFEGLKTNGAPSKFDIGGVINNYVGANTIADLDGKVVTLKVTYTTEAGVTGTLNYTVKFVVSEADEAAEETEAVEAVEEIVAEEIETVEE